MGETNEEGVTARARKVKDVPSRKQVEDHNLDHAVFRSWRPRCVTGRAATYGHKKRRGEGGELPTAILDYVYLRSEQEKEEKVCRSSW